MSECVHMHACASVCVCECVCVIVIDNSYKAPFSNTN